MPWRRLCILSAAVGLSITILEFLLAGPLQVVFIESQAILLRVVATTVAATTLLCFLAGLVGGLLSRFMGVSRGDAAAAGVVGATGTACFYLGGVELAWDHNLYALWFVFGIPIGFVAACMAIRGAAKPLKGFVQEAWPGVGPVACWGIAALMYRGSTLPGGLWIWPATALWLAGAAVVVVAVRKFPRVGHVITVTVWASIMIGALGSSVQPELGRPSDLIETADAAATPVILLTVDTLRRDALSLYGAETASPALDALAADSVIYDRAYSTAPWTYVSFTSIHSGLTPWGHGVRRAEDRIPRRASALAPAMHDHGYVTAAIGSNGILTGSGPGRDLAKAFGDTTFFPRVLAPVTRAQTFWRSQDPDVLGLDASSRQLGEYGTEWVRNHKQAPFFLWLHFFDPHNPYERFKEFPPAYVPPASVAGLAGLALEARLRAGPRIPGLTEWARALYQSEVQDVDHSIGGFLQCLKDEGIYDRALIVFASDHGDEFEEHNNFHHGRTLYNELVRVPLLVKLPHSQLHLRVAQPVSTVAIMPTILDLVGIPYDAEGFSSKSLRTTWPGPSGEPQSGPSPPVFMTGVRREEPAEAVVWDNYKFIRWENHRHEELYELQSDPNEQYNLASQQPEQVSIGRALLADHAMRDAKRAVARGFKSPAHEPLTPAEEGILKSLGYLQ